MTAPAPARATLRDLEGLPDNVVGEIIDGTLIASPRPGARHATAASALGMEIGFPFHRGRGGPGGWVILDEPELHVGANVLVPDLAGWRRERMPEIPDVAAFELTPDWVCEIASASTEAIDRGEKMPVYARAGVSHMWLINPIPRTLEVYRLDGIGWRLLVTHHGDGDVRAEPFDAIALSLAALWR